MNILSEIKNALSGVELPIETGYFDGTAPDEYIVITPMSDTLDLYADNKPQAEIQEARLSLYCKGNYIKLKNRLTKILLESDFTVSDRRYVGFEKDTKYHHYSIDIEKNYVMEE